MLSSLSPPDTWSHFDTRDFLFSFLIGPQTMQWVLLARDGGLPSRKDCWEYCLLVRRQQHFHLSGKIRRMPRKGGTEGTCARRSGVSPVSFDYSHKTRTGALLSCIPITTSLPSLGLLCINMAVTKTPGLQGH
jgi:hypothetical protein